MRKFIFGLMLGLLITSFPVAFALVNTPFHDVAQDHWAYSAITHLQSLSFIKGYPDKTFKPNQSVTRAELSVILDKMYQYNEDNYVKSTKEIEKLPLSLTDVGVTLNYPSSWGNIVLKTYSEAKGTSTSGTFSQVGNLLFYQSADFESEGREALEEEFAPKTIPQSCSELQAISHFAEIDQCEIVTSNGYTIILIHFPEAAPNVMSIGERFSMIVYTKDSAFPYFSLVTFKEEGATFKQLKNIALSVKAK